MSAISPEGKLYFHCQDGALNSEDEGVTAASGLTSVVAGVSTFAGAAGIAFGAGYAIGQGIVLIGASILDAYETAEPDSNFTVLPYEDCVLALRKC